MTEAVTAVQGIGPYMGKILSTEGIRTVEILATSTIERLVTIEGIGRVKADQFIKAARKRLRSNDVGGEKTGLNGKSTPDREETAKKAKKIGNKKSGKKTKKSDPKKSKKSKKSKKDKKRKRGRKSKKDKKSRKKSKKSKKK